MRRGDGRLRIILQLADAESGYHLWTETLDREMTDAPALQKEIGRLAARRFAPTVPGKRRPSA